MKKGYFGWSSERNVNNMIFRQRGRRRKAEVLHDNAVAELLKEMTEAEASAELEATVHAIENWQPASEMGFVAMAENPEGVRDSTMESRADRFKGAA